MKEGPSDFYWQKAHLHQWFSNSYSKLFNERKLEEIRKRKRMIFKRNFFFFSWRIFINFVTTKLCPDSILLLKQNSKDFSYSKKSILTDSRFFSFFKVIPNTASPVFEISHLMKKSHIYWVPNLLLSKI